MPAQLSPEARALQKAREEEWGTYVAADDLLHDGVLAYRKGDPVPKTNAETHGYVDDGLVVKATTKAGQALKEGATP